MFKILVAYASKHNSTAEIAYAIGEVLQKSQERQVDVQPADNVGDISPYDAVVLGSAVYMGQWQPAAIDFLTHHEQELIERPVWLFSSGPTGEGEPTALLKGWAFPDTLQPLAARIMPRDIALFHGRLDSAWLNIFERSAVKFAHASTGDSRDWAAIRAWAESIAQELCVVANKEG